MKRIAESELIINDDGSSFHLHIRPEELADTVILVGDPGRTKLVSSFFENVEFTRSSREFNIVTGEYKGKRMTVVSTGIGTDNIDIVVTELDALKNVDFNTRLVKEEKTRMTLLRIGTSGAIQPDIPLGSYVLSHVSVGFDGLLNWYAGRETFNLQGMQDAFIKHMNWDNYPLTIPYFVKSSSRIIDHFADSTVKGMTISAPGFYGPQCRVIRLPLAMKDMMSKLESFNYDDHRITNIEMESSALAGLSALLGHDAATICCIIANRHIGDSNPNYHDKITSLIKLSLDKLATL